MSCSLVSVLLFHMLVLRDEGFCNLGSSSAHGYAVPFYVTRCHVGSWPGGQQSKHYDKAVCKYDKQVVLSFESLESNE